MTCFPPVFLATMILSVVPAALAGDGKAPLPNIVLILADDLGYGDVACYNPKAKIATPNLDKLAAGGVKFTDAYSAAAVCVPSRYGLLTGCYPFRGAPLRWTTQPTIARRQRTLSSMLQSRGYTTACVGKWHCGFDGGVKSQQKPLTGGPLDRGFDQFFGQHGSLDQPPYFYIRGRRAVQPATRSIPESHEEGLSIIYQGKFWRAGKIAPDFKHEEVLDRYAEEAVKLLHSQRRGEQANGAKPAKPFLLYFALTAPHGPWLPGREFRGKSKAGPLGDFVMHVDHVVGRVLDTLEQTGHGDNTLVIFSSDNGPLWFDPDVRRYGHDSSGGFRGRKGDIWEGGIRMPFIARWPGKIPPETTSDETVCLVDVFATLAAVTGAPLNEEDAPDSHNMLPAMLGQKLKQPVRDSLILQSLGPGDLAIREGPWKFIPWLGGGGFLTKPRRVKPKANDPPGQLYHLGDDPGERNNLYQERPKIAARLEALLERERNRERTRP